MDLSKMIKRVSATGYFRYGLLLPATLLAAFFAGAASNEYRSFTNGVRVWNETSECKELLRWERLAGRMLLKYEKRSQRDLGLLEYSLRYGAMVGANCQYKYYDTSGFQHLKTKYGITPLERGAKEWYTAFEQRVLLAEL